MTTLDRQARRAVREAEQEVAALLQGPVRPRTRRAARQPRLTAAEYKAMTPRQSQQARRQGSVRPITALPGRHQRATGLAGRALLFLLASLFLAAAGWSALWVADTRSAGILAGFALLFLAGSMRKRKGSGRR